MLQARGRVSGAELARRLDVEERSVRRYVTMLQELGIPIESERGRHGGYQLRPGFKLPPLMFTEDEALAITLGLLGARRFGLTGAAPALEGALAKMDRVLPASVREQLRAVRETVYFDVAYMAAPPEASTVLAFSTAARDQQTLKMVYRSGAVVRPREVDPYGLVLRNGVWYTVGWCHLRQDVRVFRLDRVLAAEVTEAPFARPEGFDVREHLVRALASRWTGWTVEALLEASLEDARRLISPIVGTLEETASGVMLRSQADNLDWAAHYLMGLPWRVRVVSPPEALQALGRLRSRIDEAVGASPIATPGIALEMGPPEA